MRHYNGERILPNDREVDYILRLLRSPNLMDEDMVRKDCVHTAVGDGTRVVTFTLSLSPKGRESLGVRE